MNNGNGTTRAPRNQWKKATTALLELVSRTKFLSRLGVQYQGNRDVYAVAGYPKALTFDHYHALYVRGDIAGIIVDLKATTTWRHPPEIIQEGMDAVNKTEFVNKFEDMAKRLRLWGMMERVDRLSGIGQYGVLLLGTSGVTDQQLKEPLGALNGPESIIYLSAFHQKHAPVQTWVRDPGDPRFGKPETYEIDLGGDVQGMQKVGKVQVHASRVIHVAEDKLSDDVFGRPRLERIYNRLMDLEKVASATGESYWQLASRVLSGNVDPEAAITADQMKELGGRLEEMVHDLRRQFVGQGVDLKWLNSTPPDPRWAADMLMTLIAAAANIPKRILFGSETGERASEQDQQSFLGTVHERQQTFAEPEMLRELIDRFVTHKVLPDPGEDGYEVKWPTLWEEPEKDRSEANLNRARTAKELTPVGMSPMDIVEIDDDRNVWLKPTTVLEEEGVIGEEADEQRREEEEQRRREQEEGLGLPDAEEVGTEARTDEEEAAG